MLIFLDAKLAFFSIPKTGSTAFESTLKRHADIVFSGKPSSKHMSIRQYELTLMPYLDRVFGTDPERVAVIRDPLSRMGSWYRYRQRGTTKDAAKSTKKVSFNQFIEAYLKDGERPAYARFGTQTQFLSSRKGQLRVDHLFAQERTELLASFLSERLSKPCESKRLNVSPKADLEIDPDLERRLRKHLHDDFALHQHVLDLGGHLANCRQDGALRDVYVQRAKKSPPNRSSRNAS